MVDFIIIVWIGAFALFIFFGYMIFQSYQKNTSSKITTPVTKSGKQYLKTTNKGNCEILEREEMGNDLVMFLLEDNSNKHFKIHIPWDDLEIDKKALALDPAAPIQWFVKRELIKANPEAIKTMEQVEKTRDQYRNIEEDYQRLIRHRETLQQKDLDKVKDLLQSVLKPSYPVDKEKKNE